jgi:5-oxoprolinase (ATP-hydrolysing)
LLIGNQSRPRIFDLNIRRPPPLYSTVVEIDERVTLVGYTSDPQAEEHNVIFDEDGRIKRGYRGKGRDGKGDAEGPGRIVQGISGEAVRILKVPGELVLPQPITCSPTQPFIDEPVIRADLQKLYNDGFRSVAVVLAHSYTFPEHELLVGKVASSLGFEHVSLSSQLLPMIKMVPRGASATADAYLTPILRAYLDGFFSGFARRPRVEFMSSDGGLVDVNRFTGLKTILSGPAGGVVGYARTSWDERRKMPIIGSVSMSGLLSCIG